ncbi:iron-containing alcohol dehydrogenase [uncultured Mailhella sp.]|uniref:iron-containing alcohol dehydrogenase n=1 Tax=uncultured Mailhella sp. TaxID=1981031 RepID=UPI00261DAAED|nr:iron-containing alcohol dehydrogenase [uncultured Mailhella sp.]
MTDFVYHSPTKVVFGRDAENRTGELVREQGGHRVLLHYGGGSVQRTGLLDRIRRSLEAAGVSWTELGGVVPNPRLSLIRRGIEQGRAEGVDFLLAVGGGSVIDSSKAIAYGMANAGDVWDFFLRRRKAEACLPLGAVVTMAAAGSELSASCVITNEEGRLKLGYTSDLARPRFAVMNPALTVTVPPYQTACGCVDVLMHTMERWFYHSGGMELTAGFAEGLLRTVMRHALILRDHPDNYASRAEVLWASALSHNGLTGCGTDGGDWACHKLEHELSGLFDVAHGAGLSAIWGSWARFVYPCNLERFVSFATRVMSVPRGDDEETALRGIAAMEDFFRSIHMPTTLTELGVRPTDAEIRLMAEKCYAGFGGPVGKIKPLNIDDLESIYRSAR